MDLNNEMKDERDQPVIDQPVIDLTYEHTLPVHSYPSGPALTELYNNVIRSAIGMCEILVDDSCNVVCPCAETLETVTPGVESMLYTRFDEPTKTLEDSKFETRVQVHYTMECKDCHMNPIVGSRFRSKENKEKRRSQLTSSGTATRSQVVNFRDVRLSEDNTIDTTIDNTIQTKHFIKLLNFPNYFLTKAIF